MGLRGGSLFFDHFEVHQKKKLPKLAIQACVKTIFQLAAARRPGPALPSHALDFTHFARDFHLSRRDFFIGPNPSSNPKPNAKKVLLKYVAENVVKSVPKNLA